MDNDFIQAVRRYFSMLRIEISGPSLPAGIRRNVEVFFGREDWKDVASDLHEIPPADRPRFLLGLFLIVVSDQGIYANLRRLYPRWRRRAPVLKFGSAHSLRRFENPFRILTIPVDRGVQDAESLIALVPEFVDAWIDFARNLPRAVPGLDAQTYFDGLRNDTGWGYCRRRSRVIRAILETLDSRLQAAGHRMAPARTEGELPFDPPLPPSVADRRRARFLANLNDPDYVRDLVDAISDAIREVQENTPGLSGLSTAARRSGSGGHRTGGRGRMVQVPGQRNEEEIVQ